MTIYQITAVLLCLAALGGFINQKYIGLPSTIGHMAFALLVSLVGILLAAAGWIDLTLATAFLGTIDFSQVLLHGMLSFLLFAGALHINLADLARVKWPVAILATVGVVLATAITGALVWMAAHFLGVDLPLIYALLFGALIAPTDPIAVLAILKQVGAPKTLYTKIGGESLFNDGVGVVIFLTILSIAMTPEPPTALHVGLGFLREAGGGLALGAGLGWGTYRLMRAIDDYKTEALLTLALVTGGYAIAEYIHVSAPICMVAAGLVVGNHGRAMAMSDITKHRLDLFWELLDEIMNAVLFMLIGLEILVIPIHLPQALMGALAIIAVLAARLVSVALPVTILRLRTRFERGTIRLLTWGGLRGGLSIAMALSLPAGPEKNLIVPMTYVVVLFSILVQGLTFRRLLAWVGR
ncbi:MAG: sodium:proton antiporter [Rhodospirillales bacterium]|nr:sodium:proton antiporter [Alphaproteobacteria bacterium]MCB9986720.1 sodium:proton antiporter [Rhodospirillales bacterium]USO08510.1 MAG: sodium:proton antiporter [Rhodospirillales bacterium]